MNKLIPVLACFALCSFSEAQDFAQKKVDSHAGAHASKAPVTTAGFEIIQAVEKQPLAAAAERLIEALHYIGAPMADADVAKLKAAMQLTNDAESVKTIQGVLDPLCLAQVTINAESRVSAIEGNAPKKLIQQGWSTFLVKVNNAARITPPLVVSSPQAGRTYKKNTSAPRPQLLGNLVTPEESARSFLDIEVFGKQPLRPNLSGLEVEYRIVQLYSRDKGRREATLEFHVGQGTQDLGFRSEVPILFECAPAVEVVLGIRDHDGKPTTAALVVRDRLGRVYPNPARRLAPDFFFHSQVYRADGESLHLPPGDFTAVVSRGPEYLVETHRFNVPDNKARLRQAFQLTRWIEPKTRGWYSGDHHVHAAGCAHYDSPTEGVGPADMQRHIIGEDLNVGCVLSWGPSWYFQKQHFEGKASALSKKDYLMRYDVEVSGFPSSHGGHLCLLRLKEDDYPGTTRIEEWPSWTLPVLKWGQEQGGVVGYSHSGWGLRLPDYGPRGERLAPVANRERGTGPGKAADKLPDYAIPPFDGIGANEFIVTTAHGVCDFISTVDTPAIWELNIWYHTLNCGMTSRISGETDFPCIYGDKVGLGRIYVKMPAGKPLDFDGWAEGLKLGRSYCGDGLSHVLDFKVNDVAVGEPGSARKISTLALPQPGSVNVRFDVAALLQEKQTDETRRLRNARLDAKPYWHIERCRIGETRRVPVEVIVNGEVAWRKEIEADGSVSTLNVPLEIKESSWVAVRILPSVHTNPVWVTVGDQPVRASKRSAEWCIKAVEQCWSQKGKGIRSSERATAKQAYDEAKSIYERILSETIRN
ncbi:MAG: CehA/McbA family metallohydrolase [Limisphaerales bacterium]